MQKPIRELSHKTTYAIDDTQTSFKGGMNLEDDLTAIGPNEYGRAYSVTSRLGNLTPLRESVEVLKSLQGKKQGIVAVGTYRLIFVSGKAYYVNTNDEVFRIDNFAMSPTAEKVYTQIVPPSTTNLLRYLVATNDAEVLKYSTAGNLSASPAGMVVQDGVSQPHIIFINGSSVTARKLQSYEEWNTGSREYVPIGLDMAYVDGILFVVRPNRQGFYRSCTNRPLDFVVSVDGGGNKSAVAEDGNAEVSAYTFTYNSIIGLYPLTTTSLLVSTDAPASYMVSINRDQLIWGEPKFSNNTLFPAAMVNSQVMCDNLGDNVFISHGGIRSFNATKQLQRESRNEIFSGKISRAFDGVFQNTTYAAAIEYQDYLLFAVQIDSGPAIAIYDRVIQKWASFIKLPSAIKQFASLVPFANALYAITKDDKIWHIMPPTGTPSMAVFQTRQWVPEEIRQEQRLDTCRVLIDNTSLDGNCGVIAWVDNAYVGSQVVTLKAGNKPAVTSEFLDIIPAEAEGVDNPIFDFASDRKVGIKIGYLVYWTGGGDMNAICHNAEVSSPAVANNRKL